MNAFNDNNQTVRVYNYRADTGEFIGGSDAFIPAGTGLPAYCTAVEPPAAKLGHATIFNGASWDVVEDHRGNTAYSTLDRSQFTVFELGALPESATLIEPSSIFDEWDGKVWVKNQQKEAEYYIKEAENKRNSLLSDASLKISHWQTKLLLGVINEDEKSALTMWINYIDALNAIDLSKGGDIMWPDLPII